MTNSAVSSELLREVIREVVREVLREIITEEVAAAMRGSQTKAVTTFAASSSARAKPNVDAHAHFFSRGALTERHVRAAETEKATITITRKVVVTPLARERAKTSGIEIIRIEE